MDKGTRMERTARHAAHAKRIWLSHRWSPWVAEAGDRDFPLGHFRKHNGGGCRCRRKHKGNPKIVRGFCHGVTGYHATVRERIEGARFCRAAMRELPIDCV